MRGLLGFLLSRCLPASGGGAIREWPSSPSSPALPPSCHPCPNPHDSHHNRHHHNSAGAAALHLGGPPAVRDPTVPRNPRRCWSQGCWPRRKFTSPESRSHGRTHVTVTCNLDRIPPRPRHTTTDCNSVALWSPTKPHVTPTDCVPPACPPSRGRRLSLVMSTGLVLVCCTHSRGRSPRSPRWLSGVTHGVTHRMPTILPLPSPTGS